MPLDCWTSLNRGRLLALPGAWSCFKCTIIAHLVVSLSLLACALPVDPLPTSLTLLFHHFRTGRANTASTVCSIP
ncbi:hypothetical protein FB451DRAFT_1307311 [Mycena latifolia]|nr:hypothetical protein FB451DRAFT_1307311 [Mycena latifolia]